MSIKPAQIAGYGNQGQKIAQGSVANLVLFDPNANWIVDRNNMKTKSKNTPFDQMQLPGKITDVIYAGNLVLKSGKLISLESTRND
jgi:dihydroorotase